MSIQEDGSALESPGDGQSDELRGTPVRVREWIGAPLLLFLVGAASLVLLVRLVPLPGFEVRGWVALTASLVFVALGLLLGRRGYLAYSRITAADTERFLLLSVLSGALAAGAVVVIGLISGATLLVLGGCLLASLLYTVGSARLSIGAARPRLIRGLFLAVSLDVAVLFCVSVAAGVVGLVGDDLSTELRSRYVAGGMIYPLVAVGAAIILSRRWRKARRGARSA